MGNMSSMYANRVEARDTPFSATCGVKMKERIVNDVGGYLLSNI